MTISYKDSGVDVERGYEAVKLMKKHVAKTFDEHVLQGIGSFGGFYSIADSCSNDPVLVAGTDGVGTKLKLAFLLDKHDTIGQDCVAMCVNDVVCQGAKPLLFLDYIATGKISPEKIERIVKGVSDGCVLAGCSLIGGETAEMPGFYPENEYDLAGFSVGIVSKNKIINGSNIKKGNVLIGLASSGIHSNGYSLVRKLVGEDVQKLNMHVDELGCTFGEELLKPTKIYVKLILDLINKFKLNGIAHITGGGFIENIPRMIPEGLNVKIKLGSWPVLPIFDILKELGEIPERSIYNTFNMGIGMVMAVDQQDADQVIDTCRVSGFDAYQIGEVSEGEAGVELCR